MTPSDRLTGSTPSWTPGWTPGWTPTSHELASIQVLRALAAVAVVLWHLPWTYTRLMGAAPNLGTPGFLAFGYAGVDLFFAISGFIIAYVTSGRAFALGHFASRRALRILPLYAGFTALALLAAWIQPAWRGERPLETVYLLHSVSALPLRGNPYLGVGWSLEHELLFYALVGALLTLGRGRWIPWALAALFAAGVVVHVWLPEARGVRVWDYHLVSLYHVEFLAGVLVFVHRERLRRVGWLGPALAGIAGFLATSQGVHHLAVQGGLHISTQPAGWLGLLRCVGYAASAAALLVAFLNAEATHALFPRGRLRGAAALVVLVGEASFVLYLSHWFVLSFAGHAYAWLGVPVSLALPALAGAVLATLAFALACHLLVERPALRWVRRHLQPVR